MDFTEVCIIHRIIHKKCRKCKSWIRSIS